MQLLVYGYDAEWFKHHGVFGACYTAWPAAQCTCGYYTLTWERTG